jgi:hypothetical protein
MSYYWFWKCDVCKKEIPVEPYYALEIFSNRPIENRRCEHCDQWHIEIDIKNKCSQGFKPREIPVCHECKDPNNKMILLFKEKEQTVIIHKSFCYEVPPYFFPNSNGVYDPYFYIGKRFKKDGSLEGTAISAMYFFSKNGKKPGTYSPYWFVDKENKQKDMDKLLKEIIDYYHQIK